MPIINGTYVNDSLPDAKTAQQQVFNQGYTKRDMNDYSTAAYNYLMKQQEQAYNLDLWNLMNEYNSPSAQMQRFQDAGLNPNLIYSQQNSASSPQSASAASFRPNNTMSKHQQNQINMIGQVMNMVKAARETYDYVHYGMPQQQFKSAGLDLQNQIYGAQLQNIQEQGYGLQLKNALDQYLLSGEGGWQDSQGNFHSYAEGPQGQRMQNQIDSEYWSWRRAKYMVLNLLPAQADRQKALKALDDYQLDFMKGKYSAVLDLDLGLGETINQWARMLMFMELMRMF